MQMSRETILEKLKDIIVGIDESKKGRLAGFGEDTEILRELGFSSLEMVHLAVVLEETFDIRVEDLSALKLRTIGDVIDLVETECNQNK